MSSLCTYARFQSLSPLVDSRVNDVLLQTIPDINEALLQLIDVVQTTFVRSLIINLFVRRRLGLKELIQSHCQPTRREVHWDDAGRGREHNFMLIYTVSQKNMALHLRR